MATLSDLAVEIAGDINGKRSIAPMVIAQGVNLNDVTTPGEHSQQFTAWATQELNYPGGASPVAGRLFVAANTQRTQVTQFYIPYTTSTYNVYMRSFYSTWGAWRQIAFADDPMLYNSGLRDVTSLATTRTAGTVYLQRSGRMVYLQFTGLVTSDQATSGFTALTLPYGFRPPLNVITPASYHIYGETPTGAQRTITGTNGAHRFFGQNATGPIYLAITYLTPDNPPSTLPGNPA